MEAAEKIRSATGIRNFDVAVIGGSGISFGEALLEIPYEEIPYMPKPSIPGHRGVLKLFEIGEKKVLFFEGRFHYYEGRKDEEIIFIPKLCKELNVKIFIPTCASGAVSRKAVTCEVGIITDHINLMGRNPLVGLSKNFGGEVFVNGKTFYSQRLTDIFLKSAMEKRIKTEKLTLAGVLGPNYETFAEVRMLEILGADCVSMSTVPEVIASNFFKMETLALTIPVNDALSIETNHKEVLKAAEKRSRLLSELLKSAIYKF